MTASIDFMRVLEEEYRQVSGVKNRSEYKIFYGQVFPALILTLGLNPGRNPGGNERRWHTSKGRLTGIFVRLVFRTDGKRYP